MVGYEEYFRGKKITQLGLGLLGRGIGDAIFLAECGAELTITDKKDEVALAPSIEKLNKYKNIKYTLGRHELADFRDRDLILKGAGVSLDSPEIAEARNNGIPIEMDASLFARLAPKGVVLVGITGTRGKSTVTQLIYEILKLASRNPILDSRLRGNDRTEEVTKLSKVHLGGNVRDTATLPLLKEVQSGDFVVLELDSWQLQGFGEAKISPHIAVFTTFMSDHLNYYNGDLNLYFEDKSHIFLYQKPEDFLIVSRGLDEKIGKRSLGTILVASESDVPSDWNIKIPGEHNKLNIACAIKAGEALGISKENMKEAVENFYGIPGRLQLVGEIRGVKIYNDTNATTPEATLAGLRAVSKNKDVILIMGGADKGLDMSGLMSQIDNYCKAVVFLPGTGTEKLLASSYELLGRHDKVKTLEEAVRLAMDKSTSGNVMLFSPAFASFGLFKNEYDRGDQFNLIIDKLS